MDILIHKPIFCSNSPSGSSIAGGNGSTESSAYYTPYNTPPYIVQPVAGSWLPEQQLSQMQFLRFPTPPNTPPRAVQPIESGSRTQSVIMKCTSKSSTSVSGSPTESCSDHSNSSSSSSSCSDSDFLCNWHDCGRLFESLEALAQHVTLRHAIASIIDGLYYCRWIGCQRSERGFNARYKMLVHVRTHTKEKPHRCHLCEKSFSRAENLKIHIRSHSGEKPYKCHFEGCHKAYSNSSDRFKHTRTHSMEKPYMCKVAGCQKRYTDPSSLRKHVKTFKHSIQLIASQTSTCMLEASDTSYTCLPHPAPVVAVAPSIASVDSSPLTPYYLEMAERENAASDYSIQAKRNSDYVTSSSDYWQQSYRYLHNEEITVDMDIDMDTTLPLDLRVHRS